MSRIYLFFILFLFEIPLCQAQDDIEINVLIQDNKRNNPLSDTIYHSTNRMLTWKDFQGEPDHSRDAGAVTASGFAYTADLRRTGNSVKLRIWIYTFFNKKNSWKKPKIMSPYHLRHEQVHFDITRLAAQSFKSMLQSANFTRGNYKQLLKHIWVKAQEGWIFMQTMYDKETVHSISVKQQKKWNIFVEEEIRRIYPGNSRETSYIKLPR